MRLRKKNGNGGCGFCLHFAIQTGNVDSLPETPTLAQCFQYFYFDSHFRIVTESGRWSKKSKLQKDLFFFFTCQMYQVFTFKLLLHNKCFAYIPTFELLLSLYISNLKLLSSVTTPESFELRSYDLLIKAHLSVFTGFCPY